MKRINLFFPQWQGSGAKPDVYRGAVQLADSTGYEWERVAVSADVISPTERGIIGYQSVVDNLNVAFSILRGKHDGEYLFTLGGDCGIEVAPIAVLNERLGGDLAVIWLDGHGDLNTPESSPSGTFHGMPLRVLLGEGDSTLIALVQYPLRPEQIILTGVRDLDAPEVAYINANHIRQLSVEAIRTDPSTLVTMLEAMQVRNVYLHIDTDVVDPAEFGSTFYPTPDGLTFAELFNLIDSVKVGFQIVGACVTECKPMGAHDLANARALVERLNPD